MTPPLAGEDVPRDKMGYELFLALRRPGCPICRRTAQAVTRHLETTSYDNATDVETRAVLRATQGWCADHARQWLEQRDALGTALIYKDVLDNVRRVLVAGQRLDPISNRSGVRVRHAPADQNRERVGREHVLHLRERG